MPRHSAHSLLLALLSTFAPGCNSQDTTQPTEISALPPASSLTATAAAVAQGIAPSTEAVSKLPPFPDPTGFVDVIDNPYFPLQPGTRFVALGMDGTEPLKNVTDVTDTKKRILGVRVVVVLDRVFISGHLAEKTFDYYAQDKDGNVWYFGEDTKEYDASGNVISTAGTFQAGKDGASAGIVMRAHPKVGETTQQEFAPGVAEDLGTVVSLDEAVTVPYGNFHGCLKTRDFTPLDPGALEVKFYCRGIGFVKGRDISGGSVHMELTRVSH
jgi:hypothetical protein